MKDCVCTNNGTVPVTNYDHPLWKRRTVLAPDTGLLPGNQEKEVLLLWIMWK
jgi:hypothetical protein